MILRRYGTGLKLNGQTLEVDLTALPGLTSIFGDVTGTVGAATVVKLQGRSVDSAAPSTGNVLRWDGSKWAPFALAMGGDVTGTPDAATVVKLQGQPVSGASPSEGQKLRFNGTAWAPNPYSGLGRVTTVGAEVKTLATIALPPKCAAGLHMTVSGVTSTGSAAMSVQYAFGFQTDATNSTLIDTPDPIHSDGVVGTTFDLTFTTGPSLVITVTGEAAKTINWAVEWEVRAIAGY
jgi:hypothetical protein